VNNLIKFKEICKQNGIILAYLFGSQAHNGYKVINGERVVQKDPYADLDLGIILDDENRLTGSMYKLHSTLYNQLDELFLPLRLDLVFLQETHSVFQFEAIKGICIYAASESIKEEYEHKILARAADFRWVLEQYYRERLEELG
jgi:predicted nucleotidyltransferase